MLLILSPAKTQDFTSTAPYAFKNEPLFKAQTAILVKTLQNYAPQQLESVLGISPKLASLNFERYLQFDPKNYNSHNSKACIFAYQGDVYQGLQAETLSQKDLNFAEDHLLILTGLYGALRPLDAMQAYRLEMSTKLATQQGKDLYAFWHESLQNYINTRLQREKFLINLASREYSSVLDFKTLQDQVIHIEFKDWSKDRFKIIGLFAKKARGLMARFIIENKLHDPEQIKAFDIAGYAFQPDLSTETDYIFHRSAS